MKQPKFKTPFNNNRVRFSTTGPSMTHQSMAPECDINTIMRKYERDGIIAHRNTYEGHYGDFTDLPQDYQASLNAVIEAQDMFLTIPARIRKRFDNDPAQFLEFVADHNNQDELIEMGLAERNYKLKPISEVIEPEVQKLSEKAAAKAPKSETD